MCVVPPAVTGLYLMPNLTETCRGFEFIAIIIYNIDNLMRVGSTLNLHDVKWNPESGSVDQAL